MLLAKVILTFAHFTVISSLINSRLVIKDFLKHIATITMPHSVSERLLNTQVFLMGNGKPYPPVIGSPEADERTIENGDIPRYVIEHSPVVQLHSSELYYPYDIELYIQHFGMSTKDRSQFTLSSKLELSSIGSLPNNHNLFMTAEDEFMDDPEWLRGRKPDLDGKSDPAILIVIDKGNGWVDAYWFYFYSFNLGPNIYPIGRRTPSTGIGPVGNHLGDWEHTLIRFFKGEPVLIWLSAHSGGGGAYFEDVPKFNGTDHPLVFSAQGTHANYFTSGKQKRDPGGVLFDQTDHGPIWIPSKNYLSYTFDGHHIYYGKGYNDKSNNERESQLGNWLLYSGHWGDRRLLVEDERQKEYLPRVYKFVNGPEGPLSKNLMRVSPCPNGDTKKWWKLWAYCNV